jgi:hypothetical protein
MNAGMRVEPIPDDTAALCSPRSSIFAACERPRKIAARRPIAITGVATIWTVGHPCAATMKS